MSDQQSTPEATVDSVMDAVMRACMGLAEPGEVRAEVERLAAMRQPTDPEQRYEHYVQNMIDHAPEPLRRLGDHLSRVLDEDEFKTAERFLLGAMRQATEPIGWLYDWTHSSATGRPDEHFTGFVTTREEAARPGHENIRPVFAAPVRQGVPEGWVMVPPWKGYALLGSRQYLLNHSKATPDPVLGAEFFITLATDADKSGDRQVGESRDIPNGGKEVQSDEMVLRIGFLTPQALDALEGQLSLLRKENFPESVASLDEEFTQGVNAAAAMLDKMADDYSEEHGWDDPDTGVREFKRGASEDYYNTLRELSDDIRSIVRGKAAAPSSPPAPSVVAEKEADAKTWGLAVLEKAKAQVAASKQASEDAFNNTFHKVKAEVSRELWDRIWSMACEWQRSYTRRVNVHPTTSAGEASTGVPPLTVDEIKALRTAARADPRCADEHWFVLMARAIESRYAQAEPEAVAPSAAPIDLQSIEQYRIQMAGISTAAIGYCRTGEKIYPDYDTQPLRDVMALYDKYDALHKIVHAEQPVGTVDMQATSGDRIRWTGWALPHGTKLYTSPSAQAPAAEPGLAGDYPKLPKGDVETVHHGLNNRWETYSHSDGQMLAYGRACIDADRAARSTTPSIAQGDANA